MKLTNVWLFFYRLVGGTTPPETFVWDSIIARSMSFDSNILRVSSAWDSLVVLNFAAGGNIAQGHPFDSTIDRTLAWEAER